MTQLIDKQWHELTEEELLADPVAQEQKKLDYSSVLYRTEEGRRVMYDLRRRCYGSGGMQPVAVLALIELTDYMRKSSGIDEFEIIEAEASISACALE